MIGAGRVGFPNGRPTGLFPAIDRALRAITREYLDRYNPVELRIAGADAKRNAHNARTSADVMPEEYGLVRHLTPGRLCASAEGVGAVSFRRLPEAGPPDPMPLERGVRYGAGGIPLPDLRLARACQAAPRAP